MPGICLLMKRRVIGEMQEAGAVGLRARTCFRNDVVGVCVGHKALS